MDDIMAFPQFGQEFTVETGKNASKPDRQTITLPIMTGLKWLETLPNKSL